MSQYKHLTIEERENIFEMQIRGFSMSKIATSLKRDTSTISRELKRNLKSNNTYSPSQAAANYKRKRKRCKRTKLLENKIIRDKVQYLFLRQQWSPEQISNRLKYENNSISISYTTIYRGIYSGLLEEKKLNPGERGVARKLRHRGKTRHIKGKVETRGKIVISNVIQMRPSKADLRVEIGHWEVDTVLGKRNTGCVVTMADRCSRYYLVERVLSKSSKLVADKMIEMLSKITSNKVKTITPDRGKEFAKHSLVTQTLGIPFYFSDPHAPWQRPTNENFNGLLREYMPKSTDFKKYTNCEIEEYVAKLNTRPRKCLNWKTPEEVFYSKALHLT
jgi:IS30 family transposase